MKKTPTDVGRSRYGERYISQDDMTFLHSCAVVDPRCDQAHQGPQFATFHRAYLLAYENSLLAVLKVDNPSTTVRALPYWVRPSFSLYHLVIMKAASHILSFSDAQQDTALDSNTGKYRHDPDKFIFSENFFGDFVGDPDNEYVVTNGLFAFFPVPEWTSEKFGKKSSLNVQCAREEWYVGTKTTTCQECCGKKNCRCRPNDTFPRFMRGNDDFFRRQDRCIPYVTRNTWESPAINGLRKFNNRHPQPSSSVVSSTCVAHPVSFHNRRDPGLTRRL